jgi:hypothetical protein
MYQAKQGLVIGIGAFSSRQRPAVIDRVCASPLNHGLTQSILVEWVILVRNRNLDSKVGPSPCALWLAQDLTQGLAADMGGEQSLNGRIWFTEIFT